jgi:hypothetical protein
MAQSEIAQAVATSIRERASFPPPGEGIVLLAD